MTFTKLKIRIRLGEAHSDRGDPEKTIVINAVEFKEIRTVKKQQAERKYRTR